MITVTNSRTGETHEFTSALIVGITEKSDSNDFDLYTLQLIAPPEETRLPLLQVILKLLEGLALLNDDIAHYVSDCTTQAFEAITVELTRVNTDLALLKLKRSHKAQKKKPQTPKGE